MPASAATIYVHLVMDINGEPVTTMFTEPAGVEPIELTPDGLVVHIHLDGAKLAEVIAPYLVAPGQLAGQADGESLPSQQASQVPHNALRRLPVPLAPQRGVRAQAARKRAR
jgi:hypothetical protein